MKIVVTGSIAYDYLMTFPGRFLDVVVPDKMHRLSVSFQVDAMRRVRGGCAPNIAYTLMLLGADAAIMATAGPDAADYRDWLGNEGVDVSALRLYDDVFTASFFCATDLDQNQIATFYGGAMARAKDLSFRAFDAGSVALAVIAPNDPAAMSGHAAECRALGIPFVYDPSQQVARLEGDEIAACLEGAAIFIGNEYEFGIVEKKTGLSEQALLGRAPVVIMTRGSDGSTITLREGSRAITIPPAMVRDTELDPTGVGDAYRGGLLAARLAGLPWETAGRVGSIAAVYALETIGPQPARYSLAEFKQRFVENYGAEDAKGVDRLAG